MQEPLISIVIPVYNGSDYMREAIDSALAQTYKNIEVLVINDGSTDGGATDQIASSYGDKIRYFSKENGGVSSALNYGIRNMRGEYFSWLSHDDVYETDKIEKQVAALNASNLPSDTLVCCSYMHIDKFSNALSGVAPESSFKVGCVYDSKTVLARLLRKATLNGCCLLIPRAVFEECGIFDERFRFCQDALMWYQIFLKGYSLLYIDNVLVKNRIHSGQLTQTGQALFKKECCQISYLLVKEFAAISTSENNFLKMYLMSDSRYLGFKRVREILNYGRQLDLISFVDTLCVCLICAYGYLRPFIRKIYYATIRKMRTT